MATRNIDLDCSTCVDQVGFAAQCRPNAAGGNSERIYIIPLCYVDSVDIDADNIVTGITLTTGGTTGFYTVDAVPDSVTVEETLNVQTGSYSYNINFQVSALADGADSDSQAAAARDFIDSISNPYERFMLIITSNAGNGVRYLYGGNRLGMKIADGTNYTSNATITDLAGFNIVLQGSGTIAEVVDDSYDIPTA